MPPPEPEALSHLRLREVLPEDLPVLFRHQEDPEAVAMADFPSRSWEDFRAHWEKILADEEVFARAILVGGEVVGNLVCWPEGDRKLIGYWTAREYWGRGITSRALREFTELVEHRPLHACVAARNHASKRVLERCGFRPAPQNDPEDSSEKEPDLLYKLAKEEDLTGESPTQEPRRRKRRFHFNRLKLAAIPLLGALTRLPTAVIRPGLHVLAGLLTLTYFVPFSPFRRAAHDICLLARARGFDHRPLAVHRRLSSQLATAAELHHLLLREGPAAVLPRLVLTPEQHDRVRELHERHGSYVLAVPHSVGSVSYALKVAEHFESVLVLKAFKNPRAQEVLEQFFKRANLEHELASRHVATGLMKRLLKTLGEGKILVATVDRIDRSGEGVRVEVFGQRASFSPYSTRLACRRGLPVLPLTLSIDHGRVHLHLGQPILERDHARAFQEVMRQLESGILSDPGSWAFLWDRRWRWLLRAAVGQPPKGIEEERWIEVRPAGDGEVSGSR